MALSTYTRRINILTAVLIAAVISVAFFIPVFSAEEDKTDFPHKEANAIVQGVSSFVHYAIVKGPDFTNPYAAYSAMYRFISESDSNLIRTNERGESYFDSSASLSEETQANMEKLIAELQEMPAQQRDGVLAVLMASDPESLTASNELVFLNKSTIDVPLLSSVFSGVIDVTEAIAIVIAFSLALANFISQVANRGTDPIETAFKFMLEFCIVAMIILNINKIFVLLMEVARYITGKVNFIGDGSVMTSTDLLMGVAGVKEPDELDGFLGYWLNCTMKLLLPYIISLIGVLVAKLLLIQTCLELAIRKAIAPLAVAQIYKEGMRSPGARSIKKYVAANLKFAIFIFASVAGSALQAILASYFTGTGLSLAFELVLINIAVVTLMFKSGEYADTWVGLA